MKKARNHAGYGRYDIVVRLRGIEPPHTVPETIALSTELQAQKANNGIITHLSDLCKGYSIFL